VTRLLVFIALFFLAVVTVSSIVSAVSDTNATSARSIQEDDPGWDCHTMGNRVCGVSESYRSRFELYDRLFECFAEESYTAPKAPWDSHVKRCIPDFD
jgi:hypothetical protein